MGWVATRLGTSDRYAIGSTPQISLLTIELAESRALVRASVHGGVGDRGSTGVAWGLRVAGNDPMVTDGGQPGVAEDDPGSSSLRVEVVVRPGEVRPSRADRVLPWSFLPFPAWFGIWYYLAKTHAFSPTLDRFFMNGLMVISLGIGVLVLLSWLDNRKARAVARVEGRTLYIGNLGVVPADDVLQATVVGETPLPPEPIDTEAGYFTSLIPNAPRVAKQPPRPKLTLVRQGAKTLDLELPTAEDGHRLVAAMGLGPGPSMAVLPGFVWPPMLWWIPVLLVGFWLRHLLLTWRHFDQILLAPLTVESCNIIFSRFTGKRIEVGSDGVTFHTWRKSQFIGFGEVTAVETRSSWLASRLRLLLRDGRHVAAFTRLRHVAELSKTVNQAFAAYREARPSDDGSALHRGDRSATQWVTELRRLGSAPEGYRSTWVTQEALLRITGDVIEDPSRRAAAAIALSSSASPKDRARLAELSRVIAHPQLRLAVRSASNGESTETLAAALEAIAEQEAAAAKGSERRNAEVELAPAPLKTGEDVDRQ